MLIKRFALTTNDNPFDPFDDYEHWYRFDMDKGYSTCCYLARMTKTSEALSEAEYNEEIERAIDAIVAADPLHLYVKLVREIEVPDEEE